MNCKTRSAAALVAVFLGAQWVLSAQQATTGTSSTAPAKPAQAPAHAAKPAAPPANSQSSSGQPSPGAGHARILQEYPTGRDHTAPDHFSRPGSLKQAPLNASDSALVLRNLNTARSHLSGVNRAPLPPGFIFNAENGKRVLSTFDNRTYELMADGSVSRYWHGNTMAEYRKDGTPSLIHTQNLIMVQGVHGEMYFEAQLPGGTRVVGWGAHEGYVERPLSRGDGHYVQRTYLVGGRQITAVFHTSSYKGVMLAAYVPERRFGPAFYAWAEHNWPRHIHYKWPWLNERWAAPYRKHFQREYSSLAAWVEDFLLAGILQTKLVGSPPTASENSTGTFYFIEGTTGSDETPGGMSCETPGGIENIVLGNPIISETLADFDEQVRDHQAATTTESPAQNDDTRSVPPIVEAQSATPETKVTPTLASPAGQTQPVTLKKGLYIVNSPLPFHTDELNCSLTKLALLQVPAQSVDTTVNAIVLQSNPGDCPPATPVSVDLQQLQEMKNFREINLNQLLKTAETGLQRIGLPPLPVGAVRSVREGQKIPALTADAAAQIAEQEGRARATEKAVTRDAEAAGTQVYLNKR